MRILLALLLIMLPAAASALSCVPPNPGLSISWAKDDGVQLDVVIGTLIPPDRIPSRSGNNDVSAEYRIVGVQIPPGGPDRLFSETVKFLSTCVLTWCGQIPSTPVLGLFLPRLGKDGGSLLETGPCGGGVFAMPGPDQIEALRACVARGGCTDAEIETLGRFR